MDMSENSIALSKIFDGWDGTQTSIVHAIQPLTPEQLNWRPAPELRSVEELASHIAIGRVDWFSHMAAPGSLELLQKVEMLSSKAVSDEAGTVHRGNKFPKDKDEIIDWLEMTWQMIADTLNQWTVQDLSRTFRQEFQGNIYSVSYQWTIWRIMTHDIHHGGELALMLGLQGIKVPELGDLFGHLTMPPLADKP